MSSISETFKANIDKLISMKPEELKTKLNDEQVKTFLYRIFICGFLSGYLFGTDVDPETLKSMFLES
jgi:hypothetical protein